VVYSMLCKGCCIALEDATQRYEVPLDTRMSGCHRYIEGHIDNGTDISIYIMDEYFPCSCRCVIYCTGCISHTTLLGEHLSSNLLYHVQDIQLSK
jgi:hypothetical protein